ncbi:phosphate/phosphite/phosphonate ABC transporter substrate-binding protein [Beijerinckia sp. L45]|uniref:phosphate/phosphite/phosphonate ABC transporter substrate-binding protein n=1 Tax=Beijerinckia sp. L45 TaxID=1641855 RepID=UPI00131A9917|nr:phosphate/phosphite/phosphonate ABC transporter substrate-binding protein [Beijerinckia sp. L45]
MTSTPFTLHRRRLLAAGSGVAMSSLFKPAFAQTKKLRFGVGPLLPNPDDTKKVYGPVFAHLAKKLGVDYELFATTDWAGMAVAMGSGQLDVAWMGPWGYIIANNATGCQAIATAKYDDKPFYHAIVIAKPDLAIAKFPDDTRGMTMSFADVGSTSGWLIPTFTAKRTWTIDPKTFWTYREGATHAANEIAVSSGQSDLATDFDRNRNAMIASGKVAADANKIVWTSDPLPNDAIVVSPAATPEFAAQVRDILSAITLDEAKTLLPNRYTGFVPATHASYATIEQAGIAVGKIKAKS